MSIYSITDSRLKNVSVKSCPVSYSPLLYYRDGVTSIDLISFGGINSCIKI